jgi:hypothetical protein
VRFENATDEEIAKEIQRKVTELNLDITWAWEFKGLHVEVQVISATSPDVLSVSVYRPINVSKRVSAA